MRYENYLRGQESQTKGYPFSLKDIKEAQIEHIAPQTESGERLANGYCKYDKDFYENYLHCVGNLLLIDNSHNSSIGNCVFGKKLESYTASSLSQQREIKDFSTKSFVGNSLKWDKEAIDRRHDKLAEFVLKTWSL